MGDSLSHLDDLLSLPNENLNKILVQTATFRIPGLGTMLRKVLIE